MQMKKIINVIIVLLCIFLVTGVGVFVYNAENAYKIDKDFISIPLQFNPDDSSSTYQTKSAQIIVHDGFIKGIQKSEGKSKSIVIRALSPLPKVTVEGSHATKISLLIENVNPEFYARSISRFKLPMEKVKANTLHISITVNKDETIKIKPKQPKNNTAKDKYIILGDNRDGYDTFEQIIKQVNGQNPVFVIDNGDLVFSGKPNQYRLFNQIVSKLSVTLCTTLGNHDIRNNGRSTYTMLYGPSYYSFDFGDSHFIFLDSSPGWVHKQAISDEQYRWLEKDLIKAKGKRIFVITHIPPRDPRSGTKPNTIPNYINQAIGDKNWLEEKLNNYNENKDMEHGFQDPQEAAKFENLMSKYHVDTVYLSHIHSHFEYDKGGVHYLISGGAGAELLTKNSYYHYMITRIGDANRITMVELPSPVNRYIERYSATIRLFANAMYKENPVAVIFVVIGIILLILLLILKIYLWKKHFLDILWEWLNDTGKYAARRFKELFISNNNQ